MGWGKRIAAWDTYIVIFVALMGLTLSQSLGFSGLVSDLICSTVFTFSVILIFLWPRWGLPKFWQGVLIAAALHALVVTCVLKAVPPTYTPHSTKIGRSIFVLLSLLESFALLALVSAISHRRKGTRHAG